MSHSVNKSVSQSFSHSLSHSVNHSVTLIQSLCKSLSQPLIQSVSHSVSKWNLRQHCSLSLSVLLHVFNHHCSSQRSISFLVPYHWELIAEGKLLSNITGKERSGGSKDVPKCKGIFPVMKTSMWYFTIHCAGFDKQCHVSRYICSDQLSVNSLHHTNVVDIKDIMSPISPYDDMKPLFGMASIIDFPY